MSDIRARMRRGSEEQIRHVERHAAEQYGEGKITKEEAQEALEAMGLRER